MEKTEDIDVELEKEVVEKLNCVLKRHWREVGCLENEFHFALSKSCGSRVQIVGDCIGRRFWDSVLQVVNAFAETFSFLERSKGTVLWSRYEPFKGLESKSLEELAMKIDLVLGEGDAR